jgi:hypothetical protein
MKRSLPAEKVDLWQYDGWLWAPNYLLTDHKLRGRVNNQHIRAARPVNVTGKKGKNKIDCDEELQRVVKNRRVTVDPSQTLHAEVSDFIQTMNRRRHVSVVSTHSSDVVDSIASARENDENMLSQDRLPVAERCAFSKIKI